MNFEMYSCIGDTQKVKWHSDSDTPRLCSAGLVNIWPQREVFAAVGHLNGFGNTK